MGTILTDVFSDVNIYDDDIRLLQRRFVSPIGRGAISFYKYYLMDTVRWTVMEVCTSPSCLKTHRISVSRDTST